MRGLKDGKELDCQGEHGQIRYESPLQCFWLAWHSYVCRVLPAASPEVARQDSR